MVDTDRLSFLSEWQDPFSSVKWKFNLFFYPSDETVELFDTLKHRLFLKRRKCEGIHYEDLYLGATLRICSRLIQITDFADMCTRSKMETHSQKISGFLKPEIVDTKGQILKSFLENNFRLINLRMIFLSDVEAHEILRDYPDKAILNMVVQHVISGPVVAFQLLRANVLSESLNLIGPEDPVKAKQEFPDSLRARFGVDKIKNALHISNSIQSAEKDAAILFRSRNHLYDYLSPILPGESICCVIKPHAVRKGQVGAIMTLIEESGYQITNIIMCTLNTGQAEKFLEIYKYVMAEFQEMVEELCCGLCVALEVRGTIEDKTPASFRTLVGPLDPEVGRCIRSDTIRAIFGETKIRNSVHVTDLVEDLVREIQYFFKGTS